MGYDSNKLTPELQQPGNSKTQQHEGGVMMAGPFGDHKDLNHRTNPVKSLL
jgi:hypothetical protein